MSPINHGLPQKSILKADVTNRHSTVAKLQQKQIPPSCSASSFCLLLVFVSYIFSWGLPLNSLSSLVSGFKPELRFPGADRLSCFSVEWFQTELARTPVWNTLGDTPIIKQITPMDRSSAYIKQSMGLDLPQAWSTSFPVFHSLMQKAFSFLLNHGWHLSAATNSTVF